MHELQVAPLGRRTLAVLRFAGVRLALDQRDVVALESPSAMHTAREGFGLGCIVCAGREWPVYALDADLLAVNDQDAAHRICAMLALEGCLFGLLVDDVSLVDAGSAREHAVPAAMLAADRPLSALLHVSDGVVGQTTATALGRRAGADALRIRRAFAPAPESVA